MPKQKTSRAARKRFKITGAGKVLRRRAMRSHLLEKKSAKRKRRFRHQESVSGADVREVRRMLGLRKGRS
jgi:large subunit ribosomal protein L35